MTLTKSLERFTPSYHLRNMGQQMRLMLSPVRRLRMSYEHKALSRVVELVVDALPKVKEDEKIVSAYWIEDSWERPDCYIWLLGNHDKAPVNGQMLNNISDALTNKLVKIDIFNVVEVSTAPLRIEIKKLQPTPITMFEMMPVIRALPQNALLCVPGVEHKMRSTLPLAFSLNDPKNAHIGTAATTGGGKTGLCRSALMSLAILNDPAHLSLIIIDPGRVDFEATSMRFLPHLAYPIVSDPGEAIAVIKAMLALMYERKASVDDAIKGGYTWTKPGDVLLFVDEVAGLLALEPAIMKALIMLAQEGRKYGLHLWWATQRPTVDVINGHLRDNTPLRIVGPVTDADASRIASGLPGIGAQYQSTGCFKTVRGAEVRSLQSLWLTTDQVNELVPLIRQKWDGIEPGWRLQSAQRAQPQPQQDALPRPQPENKGGRAKADDQPILDKLMELVQAGESVDNLGINYIARRIGPAFNGGQELGKERAKRIKLALVEQLQ